MRDAELSVTVAPRWWVEGLRAAMDAAGQPGGEALADSFASLVPGSYVERTEPAVAAADLQELRALDGGGEVLGRALGPDGATARRMAVQPDPDPGAGMFRFRLYGRRAIELSSFLPILESFGLTVVEAVPHNLRSADGEVLFHLDDFGLRARLWPRFDPLTDGPRLVVAVQAAWQGESEVDSLNRLVVCAGMDWHDVVVLRAYRRYRRQVGTPWSDRQLDDPLVQFPAVAASLFGYFRTRFDPALAAGDDGDLAEPRDVTESRDLAEQARESALTCLAAVERLEQDQVLRAYLALIDATLRTSHFVRTPNGERLATLTLKLDSGRIPELPPPRPHVETFVYSPRVEGLHLRGGPIARGGIRWSDRQDDLRTEVLGLVRAQVLKNAGIVPTGAKGGFVCKYLADAGPGAGGVDSADGAAGPEGSRRRQVDPAAEVRECYRLFIGGLLDVTDNVVAGRVVTPSQVRPRDGEDTYLVVAADRGTATFSDLANEISAEHHFWLGDAFASGGRHGYDHKAMGITARGAWVAARQHFRQLGIDPEREEIRVIGVGDMSGDVFGNGMLRSRTMKLVAAFDHRHIFIDPDPDPEASYAERARLFALPHSSWDDYDRAVLSPGGGIWSRTAKRIVLSPEAQQVVGLGMAPVSPPELISAILTAAADLLWLGGIGTFVKAPTESHADVGDRADDAIRVDADQVRARVVAEGGNLGFTQRARIVYSRRGGRINTDFIDNAAGVATSDYEVNLKILLALAVEAGRITAVERDTVLAEVQDDVAASVLGDVGLTALAVTRAVPASATDLDAYEALMVALERTGRLDRKVESLPAPDDMAVRRSAGAGLTRPEAAVLLAMAKSDLADALEASALVADPAVADAVTSYFPSSVAARFADLVGAHRLYPQLAAPRVASEIVDRMGVTWAHETSEELGVGLAEVSRAYWMARAVLGADGRWRRLAELAESVSADAEAVLEFSVAESIHRLARRYLVEPVPNAVAGEDRIIARFLAGTEPRAGGEAPTAPGGPAAGAVGDGGGAARAPGTAAGAGAAGSGIGAAPEAGTVGSQSRIRELVALGLGRQEAEEFGRLPDLALAADVGFVTRALGCSADCAGQIVAAFHAFDQALDLAAFRQSLGHLAVTSRWGRWLVRRLEDDLSDLQRNAVLAALRPEGPNGAGEAMRRWLRDRADRQARFLGLSTRLRDPAADGQSLAALAVRTLSELVTWGAPRG
ncbi:MAG TPA: NAD-glutamate dehydrogenase domain-containing protein [Acidimicrobiales bacterium]|nr:NAD-glutamate dehydrogenase domain-containing protein [Acidimicrobiales bacterium]